MGSSGGWRPFKQAQKGGGWHTTRPQAHQPGRSQAGPPRPSPYPVVPGSPRVSCILTSFNRPKLVRQALKSVASQTWPNYELIVIDDSSCFDVQRAVDLFSFPAVRVLKSGIGAAERARWNRLSVNCNAGLRVATGDFVTFLCDDDYLFPGWFQAAVGFLQAAAGAGVGACYGQLFYSHSLAMDYSQAGVRFPGTPVQRPAGVLDHNQIVHRRSISAWWNEDPSTVTAPDAGYFEMVATAGPIHPVNAPAVVKRMHGRNLQATFPELGTPAGETPREPGNRTAGFVFPEEIESAVTVEEGTALAEAARGKEVLELGAWKGRSTVLLASVAAHVHSVDWHRGDPQAGIQETLAEFQDNLELYGVRDRVTSHVGRNERVLPAFRDASFDLAFVDSFHERAAIEADIALVRRLVRPGGLLAFHDYGRPQFGVTEAVDALCARESLPMRRAGHLALVGPVGAAPVS